MSDQPHAQHADRGRQQMVDLLTRSRRRSAALGSGSDRGHLPPDVLDAQALADRCGTATLMSLLPDVRGLLEPAAAAEGDLLALVDTDGVLLWVGGDRSTAHRMSRLHFRAGADWSEAAAGTNAPGTALVTSRPVQVIGAEHWNASLGSWSCVAAPVRHPDSGRLIGAVDVTGRGSLASPLALALLRTVAGTLEAELRARCAARDRLVRQGVQRRLGDPDALLVSPGGRVLWVPEGLAGPTVGERLTTGAPVDGTQLTVGQHRAVVERVTVDGYALLHLLDAPDRGPARLDVLGTDTATLTVEGRTIRFSPRHSEILYLLACAPAGLSAGRLAVELDEDERSTGVVRAELARLRRLLGPLVASLPYRLTTPLRTDAQEVAELLAQGRTGQALAAYRGPLLADSQAPAVAERRRALEQQLRGAVLACPDPAVLRRWVESPWGRDDVEAWAALARTLPVGSPQRGSALGRWHGLDRELSAAAPSLPPRS